MEVEATRSPQPWEEAGWLGAVGRRRSTAGVNPEKSGQCPGVEGRAALWVQETEHLTDGPRPCLRRHSPHFLAPIFYPFIMLTYNYVSKVTSVIVSPWKYGKRVESEIMYAAVVGLEDKEQLCTDLSVLTAGMVRFRGHCHLSQGKIGQMCWW